MSARDLIADELDKAFCPSEPWADAIVKQLTAAGWRLVGPDEVDPVTVERTLDAAGDYMGGQYGNTALHHPTDRARAIRAIASGGKQ